MDNVTEDYIIITAGKRWGLSPKKQGKEYHSPCFICGGRDRFMIFENGGYFCRQCGVTGWLDNDRRDWKPDPLKIKAHADEVVRQRDLQRAKNEGWKAGHQAGYWEGWHAALSNENRAWWNGRGIKDHQINEYTLGYNPAKPVENELHEFVPVHAYTIPARDPKDGAVRNVHYRLVDIPANVRGRYRFESSVTPASFYCEEIPDGEKVLVVEGAIKAMVMYDFLEGRMQVVGLPSVAPCADNLDELRGFKTIYLALDPHSDKAELRIKNHLKNVRVLDLSDKPDDLVLAGMTAKQFKAIMEQGK